MMLTTGQVAEMAAVSRWTVRREIGAGHLAATWRGSRLVIAEADARRWARGYVPYGALRKPR